MPETVLDQVLIDLKENATAHYPAAGELRNLRVVGHAPKADHFTYDLCADFAGGVERVAVKVYRTGKNSPKAKEMAAQENANLRFVHDMPARKKVFGIPRPLGDFTRLGAVVTEKLGGLPLQAMVMKAALLPGYAADNVAAAARRAGAWLRDFHKATAHPQQPLDSDALVSRLEELCPRCRKQGLDEGSVKMVLNAAHNIQAKTRKPLPHSAVLGEFTPLNVIISEDRVGFSDLSRMQHHSTSLEDVALFMASVEALEKYPFCNREITRQAQQSFLEAYGITPAESALLPVLRIKALLGMFANGRPTGENGERKRVMWANIMRRFIRQAAERTLEPVAA